MWYSGVSFCGLVLGGGYQSRG